MVDIVEREGVILLSGVFDMKIDNNRVVYVKKKKDNVYKQIESMPQGYTSIEKKKYLYNLYNNILKKLSESSENKKEEDINQKFY